jgi:O-antigen ligase
VVALIGAVAVVGVAVVLIAPGALNLETGKQNWWNRATSGRADLVEGGLRMVRDKPLLGFGSGAYADEYRTREHVSSEKVAAASHTIPLTVTAEQGIVGLVAYLALVAVSLALLFRGLRARLEPPWPGTGAVAQAAIAAAYAALLLHTLVYAAYLEDPLTWALLAIAAGLRRENGTGSDAVSAGDSRGLAPVGAGG